MRRGTLVAVVAGLCLLARSIGVAQENLRVLSETVGGAPAGEMMSGYLLRQAKPLFEQWRGQYEQRKTPEQIAAYQKALRGQFLQAIGGLPDRTPLNPKVVGVVARD
ncbi:MAG: hypothetical protein GX448_14880, partial [Planctomycetes bacterium]|nr:hypothetical protein [Planctomycetota bacterium]